MNEFDRQLSIPALLNARDLGGHPTTDGSTTRWRSLLRSDDLAQLTPAGLQAIVDYGVETVLDLRWEEEIALNPSPVTAELPNLTYRNISLLGPSASQWRDLSQDCEKEQWKCVVLQRARAELKDVLQAIAASPPGPLLFHCVAGKDRTGLIAALMLALADVEPESIACDYVASTTRLSDAYLKRYSDADPEAVLEAVRCPAQGVHNMLEYLEEQGGIRAYFAGIGLSPAEIESLRRRLRD